MRFRPSSHTGYLLLFFLLFASLLNSQTITVDVDHPKSPIQPAMRDIFFEDTNTVNSFQDVPAKPGEQEIHISGKSIHMAFAP
jgi:hypothetical protein